MNVRYDAFKVATGGYQPTYDAFCVATDGFQCPGPPVVTTFPPTKEGEDRRRREERDRRDLLDMLSLLQESIRYG